MLAQHAIAPLHESARTDEATLSEAKAILHRLDYGNDGYFFVYDLQGTLLVHSRKPELIGENRLDYRDINGYPTIEMLIRKAREGGGFVQYATEKPPTGRPAIKLTYAVLLPNWEWVLGTGIYLDDVQAVLAKVNEQVAVNNYDTLLWIDVSASLGMTVIIFSGLMLNVRGRREAQEAVERTARQHLPAAGSRAATGRKRHHPVGGRAATLYRGASHVSVSGERFERCPAGDEGNRAWAASDNP